MPRRSKKRRPNQPEESPNSASSSDHDDDQEQVKGQENIQIDLEARSTTESDHSAILYFLEQSFGHTKKSILDLNQLATQLVAQQSCGSVFYQPLESTMDETAEDDDDDESPVLGICSMLRVDQQQNKQLHGWFMDKCSSNQQAKTILQSKSI